eukprot:gb/GECG01008323.1/.p1 GENE.gb/GECG01008323.1/~~gb/GECG01008323.1/.p1  ORF type:complete len:303 (+),score=37.57 gb/GECG01008323.1/:1-909(+)
MSSSPDAKVGAPMNGGALQRRHTRTGMSSRQQQHQQHAPAHTPQAEEDNRSPSQSLSRSKSSETVSRPHLTSPGNSEESVIRTLTPSGTAITDGSGSWKGGSFSLGEIGAMYVEDGGESFASPVPGERTGPEAHSMSYTEVRAEYSESSPESSTTTLQTSGSKDNNSSGRSSSNSKPKRHNIVLDEDTNSRPPRSGSSASSKQRKSASLTALRTRTDSSSSDGGRSSETDDTVTELFKQSVPQRARALNGSACAGGSQGIHIKETDSEGPTEAESMARNSPGHYDPQMHQSSNKPNDFFCGK